MSRVTLIAALTLAQPVLAATWSYDFSGNLGDHFEHVETTPSSSTVLQADGTLKFYTLPTTQIPPSTSEVFLFKDASPTFLHDWSATVDVVVPQSLNAQIPRGGTPWAAASLLALIVDAGGNFIKGASIDLEANTTVAPRTGSTFWAGAFDIIGGGDLLVATQIPTAVSSSTVSLSFDAATGTITAGHDGQVIKTFNLSALDLAPTDRLRIGVTFDTHNMRVPEEQFMSLDNFVVTTVPEPGTPAQFLVGLGLLAVAIRGRKRS